MAKLLNDFRDQGGRLLVCTPCIKERKIDVTDLVEGAQATAAAQVNLEAMSSKAVFSF
jgi:uncharacterized protein involved in oxidation of intracellular sulfur